jgi:hypothetical protein
MMAEARRISFLGSPDGKLPGTDEGWDRSRVPPMLWQAYDDAWNSMDFGKFADIEARIGEYANAPQQAAATTAATKTAEFNSPGQRFSNTQAIASAYRDEPAVKVMADVRPTFHEILASAAEGQKHQGGHQTRMESE